MPGTLKAGRASAALSRNAVALENLWHSLSGQPHGVIRGLANSVDEGCRLTAHTDRLRSQKGRAAVEGNFHMIRAGWHRERPFLTRITVLIANYNDNQHAANENLRLQNLWDGVETMAALLAMK